MNLYFILDENGEPTPTDMVTWAHANEARYLEVMVNGVDPWSVARTEVGDRHVSTVFLGTNCNFVNMDYPLTFETIVFGPGPTAAGNPQRWPTRAAALAGHDQAVAELRDPERMDDEHADTGDHQQT